MHSSQDASDIVADRWDWRDGFTPLTKVDAGAGLVYPAQPDANGYLAKADLGARWSAVDLLAELDAEGEYWVDRGNCNGTSTSPTVGMLYFLPPR